MIYLDNSATTYPKPLVVREQMQKALRELGANPGRSGYDMSVRTSQAVYNCRERAAALLGAPGPECVVFQPSCTQALNLVIKGYLKPGDHVVVSDMEHNAVMRPLKALEAKGITYTKAVVAPGDNDATVDAFRKAMGPIELDSGWWCVRQALTCLACGCLWSALRPCATSMTRKSAWTRPRQPGWFPSA